MGNGKGVGWHENISNTSDYVLGLYGWEKVGKLLGCDDELSVAMPSDIS